MDPATAQILSQGFGQATQQRNNTNAHAYVVPGANSQAPFYLVIIVVFLTVAFIGGALFYKK